MSGMEASLRAAQENVDASRKLNDSFCLDRTNELGDETPADNPAEVESANDEQEYDWCNPPPSDYPIFFETNDIDAIPPPKVIEYVNKPFAEIHYLYNYLRVSNEDSCREYAQKQYGERLTDVDWLRVTLDGGERHQHRFEMADKPWNAPGQIELDGWGYFFEKVGLPMVHYETRLKLFSANNKLRQAAVHRFHCGLNRENLELAMMLPAILGDEPRASEIQRVYEAFLLDPSALDTEMTAFVNSRLHKEDNEPVLIPELLGQIQSLLETSAFKYLSTLCSIIMNILHAEKLQLQEPQSHRMTFLVYIQRYQISSYLELSKIWEAFKGTECLEKLSIDELYVYSYLIINADLIKLLDDSIITSWTVLDNFGMMI